VKLEAIAPSEWAVRLVPAWNDLLEGAAEPSVFLTPEWIGAWWRAFGEAYEPRLWAGWNGEGELAGLAPLYARRRGALGFRGPRVVGFMGDEAVGSEYLGLLVRSGHEEEFLSDLAEVLESDWALLDFHGLRANGTMARLIPDILGARARRRTHVEQHPCSLVVLADDYEAYLQTLGPKFRSTLRQRTNKLVKNHAVRLLLTSREEDLRPDLERFFAMHQARWAARGHVGSFHDLRMQSFYREVAAVFLRRGWLRFCHLEVDGVVRASQFGFAYRGVLHSLQESFDHSFHPPGVGGLGVILRGMAIRESIAEGLSAYDFLGGVDPFKARWGATTHYVQRVRIAAASVDGSLCFAASPGFCMIKDSIRTHVPRWLLETRRALQLLLKRTPLARSLRP